MLSQLSTLNKAVTDIRKKRKEEYNITFQKFFRYTGDFWILWMQLISLTCKYKNCGRVKFSIMHVESQTSIVILFKTYRLLISQKNHRQLNKNKLLAVSAIDIF